MKKRMKRARTADGSEYLGAGMAKQTADLMKKQQETTDKKIDDIMKQMKNNRR